MHVMFLPRVDGLAVEGQLQDVGRGDAQDAGCFLSQQGLAAAHWEGEV